MLYDLHLHSNFSDGSLSPADVAAAASNRGLKGIALTDHNGIWGLADARQAAKSHNLCFIEGIEVSAKADEKEIHILGYSLKFNNRILNTGLRPTQKGYRQRLKQVVKKCRRHGYKKISWRKIVRTRKKLGNSIFIWSDVAFELERRYSINYQAARRLIIPGGPCHVPYGNWALKPNQAINLIHKAGGIAVLAHPSIIAEDYSLNTMIALSNELLTQGLDGFEVYHSVKHDQAEKALFAICQKNKLVVTSGSDWHGPGNYPASDKYFGRIGLNQTQWESLQQKLPAA